jgi:CHASE3 domain sensor protein
MERGEKFDLRESDSEETDSTISNVDEEGMREIEEIIRNEEGMREMEEARREMREIEEAREMREIEEARREMREIEEARGNEGES